MLDRWKCSKQQSGDKKPQCLFSSSKDFFLNGCLLLWPFRGFTFQLNTEGNVSISAVLGLIIPELIFPNIILRVFSSWKPELSFRIKQLIFEAVNKAAALFCSYLYQQHFQYYSIAVSQGNSQKPTNNTLTQWMIKVKKSCIEIQCKGFNDGKVRR